MKGLIQGSLSKTTQEVVMSEEGRKKKTESEKEHKELIPSKMTKLKKTHYVCIYELKAQHMNAYSGGMPGQHL